MNIIITENHYKRVLKESKNDEFINFLNNKTFNNKRSKRFLFHGTNVLPSKFQLRDDYDFSDSNEWSGDLPEGMLFLSTSHVESSYYGRYIIPCELHRYDSLKFKVGGNNPSKVFDMDYGIDLYSPKKFRNFFGRFEQSGKSNLVISGDEKSTIITSIWNVIPRTDLAIEFYEGNSLKTVNGLNEATLYHGTSIDKLDSIKKFGLMPSIGDFVKDSYAGSVDGDVIDYLEELLFATDKKQLIKAKNAITYHISKLLGKKFHSVTKEDFEKYGVLFVVKNGDEIFDLNTEEDIYYGLAPLGVETNDYYTRDIVKPDYFLRGKKLINFFRKFNIEIK